VLIGGQPLENLVGLNRDDDALPFQWIHF
jgi:hypothetical protein